MKKQLISILLIIFAVILLFSVYNKLSYYTYYSDKENYITVTGTVVHIKNSEEYGICLAFENTSVALSDNSFSIKGGAQQTVLARGILDKLAIGDHAEFITAPGYFGDGYIMPIVAIKVDGEQLLTFDEGYESLLAYLLK